MELNLNCFRKWRYFNNLMMKNQKNLKKKISKGKKKFLFFSFAKIFWFFFWNFSIKKRWIPKIEEFFSGMIEFIKKQFLIPYQGPKIKPPRSTVDREQWTSKWDFVTACIGYAVGLGSALSSKIIHCQNCPFFYYATIIQNRK